ncbi:MAG: hypothetical protein HZC36_14265 [Armatimonadetes bacterium]|nr:hypothetical protein [Armatimonadota bacterium]
MNENADGALKLPDDWQEAVKTTCLLAELIDGTWRRAKLLSMADGNQMLAEALALVGRGKVFYDEPREFWKIMGKGGTFGEAWKRYFQVESADARPAQDGIGRKRSTFWSLLGDFTLRLPEGLVNPGQGGKQGSGRRTCCAKEPC